MKKILKILGRLESRKRPAAAATPFPEVKPARRRKAAGPSEYAILACAMLDLEEEIAGRFWEAGGANPYAA